MLDSIWDGILRNRRKVVGAAAGLVISVMIMDFGVFWTAFILLCTYGGYRVGKVIDDHKENIVEVLDRWLPPGIR
ncbi:MAG: DUF2273 domain-containing protein [Firmicutes bacterium]|nr:DUF2273 domain-containing protein [Bacillota bacterium]